MKNLVVKPDTIVWLSLSLVIAFAIYLARLISRAKVYRQAHRSKD